MEEGNSELFADKLAEYDSMTRLDAWKTNLLLKVRPACAAAAQKGILMRSHLRRQTPGWSTSLLFAVDTPLFSLHGRAVPRCKRQMAGEVVACDCS